MKGEIETLTLQVSRLETKVRFLSAGCIVLVACTLMVALRDTVRADSPPQSLTLKRLAIVDEKGVERVVIAAPLPDPVVHGKRYKRDGTLSGILIFDGKGDERGGYATANIENSGALLTLDSEDSQVFTVYANPKGDDGVNVSLQSDKRDSISISTYEQPRIQLRQNGKIIETIPATAPGLK